MKNLIGFILPFFLFYLSCGNSTAEIVAYPEFYRGMHHVKALVNNDQLDEAILVFDSLSARVDHIPAAYLFYMAQNCAGEERCELATHYLTEAFESGHEYNKGVGAYKTIDQCKEEISVVLAKEGDIHARNFNVNYKTTIDAMFEAEQALRMAEDIEGMKVMDSLNMLQMIELIDRHGFPGEKLIGHASAFNAFIILLHMDRDEGNVVFGPLLKEAYNAGQLSPIGYAWIVDRRRHWGPQELEPYYYHMTTKKFESFNHSELAEVNRRRDSIGLDRR